MSAPGDIRRHLWKSLAKVGALLAVAAALVYLGLPQIAGEYHADGAARFANARTMLWYVMELHLMFAAFVLGVPIFAMIVEIVGVVTGNEKYDRLAWEFTRLLALAFTATAILGVLGTAGLVGFYPAFTRYLVKIFSFTFLPYVAAIVLDAVLLVVYFHAWDAMKTGRRKILHIGIVVVLNLVGTVLMCIANAWATFMMSPAGLAEGSLELASLSAAIQNPLWWPINVHRFLANIAFGGAIAGGYAAIRYLSARTDAERAHYDWMGYVGNFVALWALIPLPFAGYWLGKEIYAFNAQMGTSLMGGAFSWLFIVQAVLIGVLFTSANYYMWLGLGRIPGGHRYYKYILGMEVLIFLSMAIWMTPHTLVASLAEARRMGGAHHPLLGVFGVMSAKNTVVNLVILTTFLSFVLYRRANKKRARTRPRGGLGGPLFVAGLSLFPILFCGATGFLGKGAEAGKRLPVARTHLAELETALRGSHGSVEEAVLASDEKMSVAGEKMLEIARASSEVKSLEKTPGVHHAAGFRVIAVIFAVFLGLALLDMCLLRGRIGDLLQWTILLTAAGIVVHYGIKGYDPDVSAEVRIGFSVYQVMSVLFAMVTVTAIDLFLFLGAESLGRVEWGKMPVRSQYVLVLLAVAFTLTIGLMGFVRSGIRQNYHVYQKVEDTSVQSFTPTMGYAGFVIAACALTFFGLLYVIFRFGMKGHSTEAPS